MKQVFKESIWRQFGASIDTLENAIRKCPEEEWNTDKLFWYWSYHALFWLDYYLSLEPKNFSPPSPFTMSEMSAAGGLPERVYSQTELLDYLEKSRSKALNLMAGLTDELAEQRWRNDWKDYTVLEIILYNMRHVQHHAAQLNLLLRQTIDDAPEWVSVSKSEMN